MKSKFAKPSKILVFLLLSTTMSLLWANVNTQENTVTEEEVISEVQSEEDLEVIGIVGQRTLLFFRNEMEKAELDFYDAYNALAKNDKFKVECRRENRGSGRIRVKVCYPQYVLERMAQETQDALANGLPYPSLKDIEFAVKEEREESMAYVEKVVTENPQLLEKLIALNEKQAKFENARQNVK